MAQSAPGPMSKAHEKLGGTLECTNCHIGFSGEGQFGVSDEKCLSCHTHQPLRARIRAGKGFHAAEGVKDKPCAGCHPEHKEEPPGSGKGRTSTIDWKPFGTLRNFDHGLTGWPLDGAHRYQKCEACHTKRYPKTKLPTYLGLRGECTTCHYGTKIDHGVGGPNPHQFTDQRLTDCLLCHTLVTREIADVRATKFDHDKTAFPIAGEHRKTKCIACHKEDIATFKVKSRDFSDCRGCHQDSHKSVISAKRKCASCHQQKIAFEKTVFDHGQETKWPLRGLHEKNRCKDCHKIGSPPVAPDTACATCHRDVHDKRFGTERCEACHSEVGFARVSYAHDKKTKFPLTGAHAEAKCTTCHRGGLARNFERFVSVECASCHRHQEAHCGQFGMENCERCHVRGGDRTSKFDHAFTRLPLEASHAPVECGRCHKPAKLGESKVCANTIKYTGLEPECSSCHVDMHRGELGSNCSKCHTSGQNFKTVVFDHDKDTRFALTGFHGIVPCRECHRDRKYKLGQIQCYGCHAKDDVHQGRLGDDCAKCHETTGGAPKFDHDVVTRFPREGVHARIECERCHFLRADGTPSATAGTAGAGMATAGTATAGTATTGATASVVAPRTLAATAPPGAPLDLEFRAQGTSCVDCHPDPHGVRPDLDCRGCHGFEAWSSPSNNAYHELAGFRLEGAHTVVACSLCHVGGGSMRGRGERCGGCHTQDDVHAGSLGAECGRCHGQSGWVPTTFTHVDTGLVLQGVHRALECRQCHQAGNYFISTNCYACHLQDYRASTWHTVDKPDPSALPGWRIGAYAQASDQSLDCGRCHNQFTFRMGTYLNPR